jgi:cytidylate kinase
MRRRYFNGDTALHDERGRWRAATSDSSIEAEAARILNPSSEKEFDRWQCLEVGTHSDIVADCWFLPWICRIPAKSVYLRAPLEVRIARAMASRKGQTAAQVGLDIEAKDSRAKSYAMAAYGVDILDLSVFDIVIDTDGQTPSLCAQAVVRGLS